MGFFKSLKGKFESKRKELYCSSCGSSNLDFHSCDGLIICKDCNIGDDRVIVHLNCCICGKEISLNTKYHRTHQERNIRCGACMQEDIEAKESEKDDFFDLYKTCKNCGKQYKVNNKCNDGICCSCQLESIKTNSNKLLEDILYKEVKCCKECGKEFYSKYSKDICDNCRN